MAIFEEIDYANFRGHSYVKNMKKPIFEHNSVNTGAIGK